MTERGSVKKTGVRDSKGRKKEKKKEKKREKKGKKGEKNKKLCTNPLKIDIASGQVSTQIIRTGQMNYDPIDIIIFLCPNIVERGREGEKERGKETEKERYRERDWDWIDSIFFHESSLSLLILLKWPLYETL